MGWVWPGRRLAGSLALGLARSAHIWYGGICVLFYVPWRVFALLAFVCVLMGFAHLFVQRRIGRDDTHPSTHTDQSRVINKARTHRCFPACTVRFG